MSTNKRPITTAQKYRMAKVEVEEIGQAIARYDRERQKLATWADPEDKRLLANQQNADSRDALLDRVVPDRRCPGCKQIVLARRSWIVKDGQCVCRSCWASGNIGEGAGGKMVGTIARGEPVVTYAINGTMLVKARRLTRLSINRFAELCEWRAAYQFRLERNEISSIPLEKLKTILKILKKFNVETDDKHGT